jgi:hypothetical protein
VVVSVTAQSIHAFIGGRVRFVPCIFFILTLIDARSLSLVSGSPSPPLRVFFFE